MMQMCIRWFGNSDPVRLAYIRQIPRVRGIVGTLEHIAPGEAWPLEDLRQLKSSVESADLQLTVIESIPVHEAIKSGAIDRDRYIENYIASIRAIAAVGVKVLCYNFMPVFNWTRTELAHPMTDGSTALAYQDAAVADLLGSSGLSGLPGWDQAWMGEGEAERYIATYKEMPEEQLFENYAYFLKAILPAAEEAGVKLALHPDDPPWPLMGIPRIVRDQPTLQRILDLNDSPYHGLTFCTGSLGASSDNHLEVMAEAFASRIHFVHARNVKVTGKHDFLEVEHPHEFGDVDLFKVLRALLDAGYDCPIRPDHGRMIWGETGRPGYGLYDRALGAMYISGLLEGIERMS